jgi:hypothetical protein
MRSWKPSLHPRGRIRHACVVLLALAVGACSRAGPEQRLLAQFETMQEAAEEGRMSDFMESVSEDFAGTGGVDRAALHNMLRMQALARSNIGVTTGPVDVVVRNGTATVRVTALLTGGSGRFVPDSAQAYEITSGWREEGGEWRVYYAEWKPRQ